MRFSLLLLPFTLGCEPPAGVLVGDCVPPTGPGWWIDAATLDEAVALVDGVDFADGVTRYSLCGAEHVAGADPLYVAAGNPGGDVWIGDGAIRGEEVELRGADVTIEGVDFAETVLEVGGTTRVSITDAVVAGSLTFVWGAPERLSLVRTSVGSIDGAGRAFDDVYFEDVDVTGTAAIGGGLRSRFQGEVNVEVGARLTVNDVQSAELLGTVDGDVALYDVNDAFVALGGVGSVYAWGGQALQAYGSAGDPTVLSVQNIDTVEILGTWSGRTDCAAPVTLSGVGHTSVAAAFADNTCAVGAVDVLAGWKTVESDATYDVDGTPVRIEGVDMPDLPPDRFWCDNQLGDTPTCVFE